MCSAVAFADAPVRINFAEFTSDIPEFSKESATTNVVEALTKKAAEPNSGVAYAGTGPREVTVKGRAQKQDSKVRMSFQLSTDGAPTVSDVVAFDFPRPSVSANAAMVVAAAVCKKALAIEQLRRQKSVATPAPSANLLDVTVRKDSSSPARSQEPRVSAAAPSTPPEVVGPRDWHLLDIGVSGGFNSTAGTVGAHVQWSPVQFVGIAADVGASTWGLRVTPTLRVYPAGLRRIGVFIDGGVAFNFGGDFTLTSVGTTHQLTAKLTPVVAAGLGIRKEFADYFFIEPRIGWAFRLLSNNVAMKDGSAVPTSLSGRVDVLQHQGLTAALALGVTFL